MSGHYSHVSRKVRHGYNGSNNGKQACLAFYLYERKLEAPIKKVSIKLCSFQPHTATHYLYLEL